MSYDLVIRNGTIVDGSGDAPYRGDVGIQRGTIASVGDVEGSGTREIDADGHVVTPGFIDGHTHMDAEIFWDPQGTCSCWHGVTTVVMGNCGFTLAPAKAAERSLVVRNLERAEDISPAAMAEGIHWSWETFPEYLKAIDALPKGINYGVNVGHSALRTWAMGERAFEETATPDDLAEMERAMLYALAAGAIGLSTSRTHNHETSDRRPVASRIASWDEVRYLTAAMGRTGGGVLELALEEAAYSTEESVRDEPYRRLRALAVESGVPVTFGIVPVRSTGAAMLELIDSTVAAGGQMFGMSHSRGVSIILSFSGNLPFDSLPEWRRVRALPHDEQVVALRDSDVRAALVAAAHSGDYGSPVAGEPRKPDYDLIKVLDRPIPPNPTVAETARQRGLDPVELMIDLAIETNLEQMFVQQLRYYDDAEMLAVMRHPRTVMTFSDAGAHVSQILDCSIQTHLLAYWVREREEIALEHAVSMITLQVASRFGIADRGLLEPGYKADVNVFDPARVGPTMPWLDNDLPGGAKRLKQRAEGILATVVAGRVTFENGEATGELPGTLVRGSR